MTAYFRAGIISASASFQRFVQGFNTYESFAIIDAGDHKEAADYKIRSRSLSSPVEVGR